MPVDASASPRPCAIVVGVGARRGIGGALTARFAREGLPVYAVGRDEAKLRALSAEIKQGEVLPRTLDATQAPDVAALFDQIAAEGHVPELVVFNAAEPNIPKALLETQPEDVERMWRVGCFAGFLVGREAIARMLPQRRGTLILTGATASLRGAARFGAFAAAKAGLRAHGQAMAREFGPQGIHVAHVIIDGIVDGARVANLGDGLGQALLHSKGSDGVMQPDAIAEAYWQLHCQHPSAWTQELDLRPYKEPF